jgi:hypothetical protein
LHPEGFIIVSDSRSSARIAISAVRDRGPPSPSLHT